MLWRKVKTLMWWLLPKLNREKRQLHTIVMILTRRKKTQKKTIFENYSDDAIPESVSKLNKINSYDDTNSDSYKFVVYAFLFVPILDLVCILYFLSVSNYCRCRLRSGILFPSEQRISMLILWN